MICEEETELLLNDTEMKVRLKMATVCANTVQCVIQHNRHLTMAEQQTSLCTAHSSFCLTKQALLTAQ